MLISADDDANVKPFPSNARPVIGPVCPFKVRSYCAVSWSHNRIVQSSEPEAKKLYTGWVVTAVTAARCPLRECFAGGLGRARESFISTCGGPAPASPSAAGITRDFILSTLASNSSTLRCKRTTDVHFFSSRPLLAGSAASVIFASSLKASADFAKVPDCEVRYSYIAALSSLR
jgi:hypothetical protein